MESEFYPGQKVRLSNSDSRDVFEVVSWNDSSNSGRIEDKNGRGLMVTGEQIVSAESPEMYPVNYWDIESDDLENED
jgi:hypothetical protein